MAVVKYFLLLLGVCGLFHTSSGITPNQCGSARFGNTSIFPLRSATVQIPADYSTYELRIPDGQAICGTRGMAFVGELVEACDVGSPPLVVIQNALLAILKRTGTVFYPGTATVTYYCEIYQ